MHIIRVPCCNVDANALVCFHSAAQYDYYCSLLDGPLASFDSTTYGNNDGPPLDNFHVCNGQLPQDITHVLFERDMPLNVKLMLHRFVYKERFFYFECSNLQFSV